MSGHSRRKPQRKNSYPLLKQLAEVATDEWWKNRLILYSEGSLPRGVLLNGAVISYVNATTEAHYELSEDLESAYREICAFFALHIKIGPSAITEPVIEK